MLRPSTPLLALLALAGCSGAEPRPDETPGGAAAEAEEARVPATSGRLILEGDFTRPDHDPAGFLALRRGTPVFVTARSAVQLEPDPVRLPDWEVRVERATARFGGHALELGPPACAGLDVWASDVLLLALAGEPDALESAALEPLPTTDRVPSAGDTLELVGEGSARLLEVFPDAFLELEPATADAAPEPGSAVLDSKGRAVAVVSATREDGGQRRVDAQLLLPFLDSPARLAGERLGQVAPPLAEASFSVDGRLLAASTPAVRRVVVVEREERRPWGPLEALDEARAYGLGHFTADGFGLAALGDGRSGLFDLDSGIPLASLAAPAGSPRQVASDRRYLAVTTDVELLVVDLTDFGIAARVSGGFGPVAVDGGRVLVGAGTRVLALRPEVGGEPEVWAELAGDDPELPPLVTALHPVGDTVWIGTAHGLWSAPNAPGPVVARRRLRTGYGSVNGIGVDGPLVWLATGGVLPGEDGAMVTADCYVRVFDAEREDELARSHDHDAPVRALARDREGWLGLTGEGTAFRWRPPER